MAAPPFLDRTYCQRALTSKQFGYVGSYSRQMLEVEEMPDRLFGETLYRFTTSILSGRTVSETQRATVKVPASWWQHLKKTAGEWHAKWLAEPHPSWRLLILPLDILTIVPRAFLIPWFLRRHPVRYAELTAEVRFTRETLYPGADISLPPDQFGYPVMWETIEHAPTVAGGEQWALEDYGPARFLDRHEIAREVMRDPDLNGSYAATYGDPTPVFGTLEWLKRHGVNVDQIVAR